MPTPETKYSATPSPIAAPCKCSEKKVDEDACLACKREAMLVQYQVISSRRESVDSMLWQAPVISLTAQAFLLNVVLTSNVPSAVGVASVLSLLVSVASLHLMWKHRHFEVNDSKRLHDIERANGLSEYHPKPTDYECLGPFGRSYDVWIAMLSIFAIVSAIFAYLAFASNFTLTPQTATAVVTPQLIDPTPKIGGVEP
jgi:uncharacterized membrane protein YhaH (DUF805 family)